MVDCKVISCELVWRNAERDRDEGGTANLIPIRTGLFIFVALITSRLTRGYFQIRYDNFMFIEN
jgi:hypothetical protein